jgi:plasmid stabilization system protein ParE
MRVRYTPRAFADRERIFDYLMQRSASGASNVMETIRAAVAQLGEQPYSGYATDLPDVRVKFIGRYRTRFSTVCAKRPSKSSTSGTPRVDRYALAGRTS